MKKNPSQANMRDSTPPQFQQTQMNPKESKTQLLRSLDQDMALMRKNMQEQLDKHDQLDDFLRTSFKPTVDNTLESLEKEIKILQQNLESEKIFAREITGWIKKNLGTSLEVVTNQIDTTIKNESKRQDEAAKKREEALWLIFDKKFEMQKKEHEEYRKSFMQERKSTEEEMWEAFEKKLNNERSEYTRVRELEMKETESLRAQDRKYTENEKKTFESMRKRLEEDYTKRLEEDRLRVLEERKMIIEEKSRLETEKRRNWLFYLSKLKTRGINSKPKRNMFSVNERGLMMA